MVETIQNRLIGVRASSRWLVVFSLLWFGLPIIARQMLGLESTLPLALASSMTIVGFLIWPVRGLVVFVLIMLFIDTYALWAGTRVKQLDEISIPFIAIISVVRGSHRIWFHFSPLREAAVLALMVAAVMSSILGGVAPEIWLPGLLLLIKAVIVFYVVLSLEPTLRDLEWATRLFLGVGIGILLIALVELFLPNLYLALGMSISEARAGLPALKSIFYHQQLFGWFCGLLALFLIAHHVVFKRVWMLGMALLFSVGTILSARRRAILAVLAGVSAGLGWAVALKREGMRGRVMAWAPSVIGVVVLSVVFLPAFEGLYDLTVDYYVEGDAGASDPSGSAGESAVGAPARTALYETSVLVAADHFPLGAGLGQYGSWMSRVEYSSLYFDYGLSEIYGLSPEHPRFITDTFWPQILGETGFIGLAAYVALVSAIGWQLWRASRRRDLPPALVALTLGAGMIFAQTLVESLASPIFNSPPQIYLIMLAIGASLNMVGQRQNQAPAR